MVYTVVLEATAERIESSSLSWGTTHKEFEMGFWAVPSTKIHPEAKLVSWRVYQLPNGDRHFNGFETTHHEGRATSKVVAFDPKTMTGQTQSGRHYTLVGPPGHNMDADYTWNAWARYNELEDYEDVSEEVYESNPQGQAQEISRSQFKRIEAQKLP